MLKKFFHGVLYSGAFAYLSLGVAACCFALGAVYAVRSAAASFIEKREKRVRPSACNVCYNGEKRVKKAVICEIPLRRAERLAMQDYTEKEVLGEKFLRNSINYLKAKDLSAEDAERLAECEKLTVFPVDCRKKEEKNRLSAGCGGLITLLAKYR
ncbi:MAG: hypothetical protein J6Z34_02995 [Clostridia bacterium]|nr:hypothetical protein [Clostridia bacterium]